MRKKSILSFGLALVLPLLIAACGGTAPSAATEEPNPLDSVAAEEPQPLESVVTEEPTITGLSTGEIAPDFTLPDSDGNMVSLAEELQKNEHVVLVFYFGYLCPPCMAQLREIERDRARYEEMGAQVIAIAAQTERGAQESLKKSEAQFPILADRDHAVAEAFAVEDNGWSTPSVFIINQDGQIVWKQVSHIPAGCGTERVPSQAILDQLAGAGEGMTAAVEEETVPTVSVTLNSSVHSSDLGGYAWIQEFLSSNDLAAADVQSWTESARSGAVCYASIAPTIKSAPSAADGSFSVAFEAEPGSTFRIMCDPDERHPAALGIDVFTVPAEGGTIDHVTAGFLYPGLWTPELDIANELAAKAAGYSDAAEMFETAGTCRALALPGERAAIAVSDGDAYGFFMEAPDTHGRVTYLTDSTGAYIVIKEFGAGDSEADIDIEFTDKSGAGLTWPKATCPIRRGFSTHLEVLPE